MIKKIFSSKLGKGALVLFITMNIFNVLNLVFHFIMGRMLGPSDYGVLAVLMSLIYLYSLPSEVIQNIISRYTSKFNLKKENGKIKFLMLKSLKKGFKAFILIFLIVILVTFFLSNFLKINFWLIFITNLFIFFSLSVPIFRGVLQGRKKFGLLGSSMIIESGFKLFFGILLVSFGFRVFGVMTGVLVGSFLGLIFAFYFNKDIFRKEQQKTSFDKIYSRSISYFITLSVIFIFYSLDIILARRFFSPELAGKYAVLSMLGKTVFLGTMAISKAMFPLTSEKHDNNEDSFGLFKNSILIISILCIISILFFIFFPKLIILTLYGSQYIDIAPFLIYSGLAFSFLSLSNLNLMYKLSTKGIKKSYYLFVFLIIEIVLLSLFHGTILEYILAFMISSIIMFVGSLFFIKE